MPEDAPRCPLCGVRITHWTDVAPVIDPATVDYRCRSTRACRSE